MKDNYTESLESVGANVEWIPADGTDCVLKAQLIRMLAFDHPLVSDEDIVMTVDVNAFLMNDGVVKPVLENPDMVAWVPQYEDTAHIRSAEGETFNQNFIAMRAKDWRRILDYRKEDNVKEWLGRKIEEIDLDRNHT